MPLTRQQTRVRRLLLAWQVVLGLWVAAGLLALGGRALQDWAWGRWAPGWVSLAAWVWALGLLLGLGLAWRRLWRAHWLPATSRAAMMRLAGPRGREMEAWLAGQLSGPEAAVARALLERHLTLGQGAGSLATVRPPLAGLVIMGALVLGWLAWTWLAPPALPTRHFLVRAWRGHLDQGPLAVTQLTPTSRWLRAGEPWTLRWRFSAPTSRPSASLVPGDAAAPLPAPRWVADAWELNLTVPQQDFSVTLSAGERRTAPIPFRVQAGPPLRVIQLGVQGPGEATPRVLPLTPALSVTAGSRLHMSLARSAAPLTVWGVASERHGSLPVRQAAEQPVPRVSYTAEQDDTLRLFWQWPGEAPSQGEPLRVSVVPDTPPRVTLLLPAARTVQGEQPVLRVLAEGQDEQPIGEAWVLVTDYHELRLVRAMPLAPGASTPVAATLDLPLTDLPVQGRMLGVMVAMRGSWPKAPLGFSGVGHVLLPAKAATPEQVAAQGELWRTVAQQAPLAGDRQPSAGEPGAPSEDLARELAEILSPPPAPAGPTVAANEMPASPATPSDPPSVQEAAPTPEGQVAEAAPPAATAGPAPEAAASMAGDAAQAGAPPSPVAVPGAAQSPGSASSPGQAGPAGAPPVAGPPAANGEPGATSPTAATDPAPGDAARGEAPGATPGTAASEPAPGGPGQGPGDAATAGETGAPGEPDQPGNPPGTGGQPGAGEASAAAEPGGPPGAASAAPSGAAPGAGAGESPGEGGAPGQGAATAGAASAPGAAAGAGQAVAGGSGTPGAGAPGASGAPGAGGAPSAAPGDGTPGSGVAGPASAGGTPSAAQASGSGSAAPSGDAGATASTLPGGLPGPGTGSGSGSSRAPAPSAPSQQQAANDLGQPTAGAPADPALTASGERQGEDSAALRLGLPESPVARQPDQATPPGTPPPADLEPAGELDEPPATVAAPGERPPLVSTPGAHASTAAALAASERERRLERYRAARDRLSPSERATADAWYRSLRDLR